MNKGGIMRKLCIDIGDDLSSGPDINLSLTCFAIEHCHPQKKQETKVSRDYSLHFVIYGKGVLRVGDNSPVAISRGMAFLIYPGESYVYSPIQEDPWTYVWVSFLGENMDSVMENCGFTKQKPYQDIEDFSQLREVLNRMLEEYDRSKVENITLSAYFLRLVSHFITSNRHRALDERVSAKFKRVREILIYITCNYRLQLTIEEVAAINNISPSYMMSIFSSIVGMSFTNYLNAYRVTVACVLLQQREQSIEDIAIAVGFNDSKYFTRVFKKVKGMSPREYKKLHNGEDPFKWLQEKGIDFH